VARAAWGESSISQDKAGRWHGWVSMGAAGFDGEHVVAARWSAPLLDVVEASLDDVAVLGEVAVVADRSATAAGLALAVADLVCRFRDDGLDAATAEQAAVTAAAVGLVCKQCVWSTACSGGSDARPAGLKRL
jgi:hypothetical protein